MLEDSLIFELSSLAPLKGTKNENLDPRKKSNQQKRQSVTLLSLILKLSGVDFKIVLKIVKTKIRKQKLWFLLYIPPLYFNFYVNFPFPSITFQKQNFVTNSKHI